MKSSWIGIFVFVFCGSLAGGTEADECRALLQVYPDSPALYDRLGIFLAAEGDFSNAEDSFRKAVKLDRLYGRSWYHLGVLKMNLGEVEEAIGHFILAATVDEGDMAALINLGSLYSIRNDLPMAARYYQRVSGPAESDPDLLNNLGILAIKARDYPSAVRFLEQAFRLKEDGDIRFNLAVAASYAGQKDRIRDLYPFVTPGEKHYADILRLLKD